MPRGPPWYPEYQLDDTAMLDLRFVTRTDRFWADPHPGVASQCLWAAVDLFGSNGHYFSVEASVEHMFHATQWCFCRLN